MSFISFGVILLLVGLVVLDGKRLMRVSVLVVQSKIMNAVFINRGFCSYCTEYNSWMKNEKVTFQRGLKNKFV